MSDATTSNSRSRARRSLPREDRRSRGAGRQPTCEHAERRDPEAARSDGSASTSCCVIRGAGISVHGTAVTDRRWNRPIVDAKTVEHASCVRLPGVRATTAGDRYHGCGSSPRRRSTSGNARFRRDANGFYFLAGPHPRSLMPRARCALRACGRWHGRRRLLAADTGWKRSPFACERRHSETASGPPSGREDVLRSEA